MIYLDPPDIFGQRFREKLENHPTPIDDNAWNKIEQRLKGKKKVQKMWLWGAVTTATATAATVTLLLFTGQPVGDVSVDMTATIYEQPTDKADQQNTLSSETIMTISSTKTLTTPSLYTAAQPQIFHDQQIYTPKYEMEPFLLEDSGFSENQIIAEENSEEKITQTTPDHHITNTISLYDDEISDSPTTKKQNQWLLAAAFGTASGGSPDNSEMYYADIKGSDGFLPNSGSGYAIKNDVPQNYKDVQYNVPLSVGITVRKSLNEHWAIESGLVYTYLSAKYIYEGSSHELRQRLHYLGIPANIVAYVWTSNPNWKLYVSAGGMIEKGLRNITIDTYSQSYQDREFTTKTSIDGLQYSLNGAFGINYCFDSGFGLYLEPRVSYYFDNNQPTSIRSDWPLTVGINAGLNYMF